MKSSLKSRIFISLTDNFLVILASVITVICRPNFRLGDINLYYLVSFLIFLCIWMVVSHLTNKFRLGEKENQRSVLTSVFFSNFIILAIVSTIVFLFGVTGISRFMVFGTLIVGTILESIAGILYVSFQNSPFLIEWIGPEYINGQFRNGVKNGTANGEAAPNPVFNLSELAHHQKFLSLKKSITEEAGEEVASWVISQIDIANPKTLLLATSSRFNVDNQPENTYTTIVNLTRINDTQRINKFFESVNAKLPVGGLFIGCGETYQLRKDRILRKYPLGLNYFIYSVDFFFRRICPKLKLTRKLYFLVSRGKNRLMSRTETLGRLFSCGFRITEEKRINHLLFWKAVKDIKPFYDYNPTYGILVKLLRVGKNGREFNVYKMRTMNAYAEYVQSYIYERNHLDETGKFKDDFRVTTLGRLLRKFWLDEFPMLFNVLKGDMKIVGVRPLSKHFFSLYSPELQQLRIRYKPGLIPPYYAQYPTPTSLDETQANEKQYLSEYTKHPFRTDVRYFFRAIYNIVVMKARSK